MKGLIIDLSNPKPKFHVIDEGIPLRISELMSALNEVQASLIGIITEGEVKEDKENGKEAEGNQH